MVDQSEVTPAHKRLQLLATIVLSAATVLTAWSAFESAKWSGVQNIAFSRATASRTESVRASTAAGQFAVVDATVFTSWLTAQARGEQAVADEIEARFRDEFRAAFDEWVALDPFTDAAAPPTPFALESYGSAGTERAVELEAVAQAQFVEATDANQRSDNYVLMTVLLSGVLFFGAISTQFVDLATKRILVAVAAVTLVVSVAVLLSFPIRV